MQSWALLMTGLFVQDHVNLHGQQLNQGVNYCYGDTYNAVAIISNKLQFNSIISLYVNSSKLKSAIGEVGHQLGVKFYEWTGRTCHITVSKKITCSCMDMTWP